MSILPVSLFKERPYPKQVHRPSDILKKIFLELLVADLERMHLGCHQWLCLMNNMAKEVVKKHWPHLFAEYDHPHRNWIPIFCIKRRAIENIVTGRFQLIRLQFDDTRFGRGIDLGKLVLMDYAKKMGILSLEGGGIYRRWQKTDAQACLGRIFGECTEEGMRLWNIHTGRNLLHLAGEWDFQPSLYDNCVVAVEHSSKPKRLFLWDYERQLLRQLLPPPGFTQLELSIPRSPRVATTSLASQELAFIWSALQDNQIKDQVVAVYQFNAVEKDIPPQFTYKLSLTFRSNYPIRSVHRHEGYTLVSVDPEQEFSNTRRPGWIIFDKNNTHIDFPERIQRVVWMPGKIVFAAIEDYNCSQSLHVLDTSTGVIGEPMEVFFLRNTKNDVSWLQAIDDTHIAYLGYGASCSELFVVDIKTMQKRSCKIPAINGNDFLQGNPVSFDGEKLVWSTVRNDLYVIDFTARNPTAPRTEIIEAPRNISWRMRVVIRLKGYSRYWWLGAAIVILGFTYFRRKLAVEGQRVDKLRKL